MRGHNLRREDLTVNKDEIIALVCTMKRFNILLLTISKSLDFIFKFIL